MFLTISKLIYQIFVGLYYFILGIFSLFNEKAYKFTRGRINQTIAQSEEKTIWFHCASLGEFEQAKPLISWCYNNLSEPIILTFFSPSGYTYKNNYPLARAVYYLPTENPMSAKAFIDNINPYLVFFIKYEFWYFYLNELTKRKIPHYLVAGIFRNNQLFFKSIGHLHKEMLHGFDHVFVQDKESLELLQVHGFEHSSIALDSRFDTVVHNSALNYDNEVIEEFIGKQKCLVIGSSWAKDEALLKQCITQLEGYKIIIAPHEVHPQRIKSIQQAFSATTLLSNPLNLIANKILIIDSIGKLSALYRYADLCYIGGGFGVSVHNVLEAAVYGKALMYGPKHKKSKEAMDLVKLGAAITIQNKEEFINAVKTYDQVAVRNAAANIAKNYVSERTGGTETVMLKLLEDGVVKKRRS